MPKTTKTFSTSDLSRKSGDIIAEALRHPVMITQRNKPRLVMLNIEDFHRLQNRADVRGTGTVDTISGHLFAEFEDAVEVYAESDEVSRP